jgi:hypothetical protein
MPEIIGLTESARTAETRRDAELYHSTDFWDE